jgi:hypothetical protein
VLNYEIDGAWENETNSITRADILACNDDAQLSRWLDAFTDTLELIKMQVDGFKEAAQVIEPEQESLLWFRRACRAKAATEIGQRNVRLRMRERGILVSDPLAAELASLKAKLAEMTLRARAAEIECEKMAKEAA